MNLSPHLRCEEEAHPRGKILRFAGEADFLAVRQVASCSRGCYTQKIPFLIVDLSGVTFLNTPFWAAMQRYQLDGHPDSRARAVRHERGAARRLRHQRCGPGSTEGGGIAVYDYLEAALAAA